MFIRFVWAILRLRAQVIPWFRLGFLVCKWGYVRFGSSVRFRLSNGNGLEILWWILKRQFIIVLYRVVNSLVSTWIWIYQKWSLQSPFVRSSSYLLTCKSWSLMLRCSVINLLRKMKWSLFVKWRPINFRKASHWRWRLIILPITLNDVFDIIGLWSISS
jgi:hypothetical protein